VTVDSRGPESAGRSPSYASLHGLAPGSLVHVRTEWISFYDTQYHRVVRFVMHNGASQADAQDAAQEAFIESWALMSSNPGRWQAITGKEAWIRTVALRRYWRPPGSRRRPMTAGNEIPDLPAPGPGHEEFTVQAQLVLQALRELDHEARTVMAFDLDDIPSADIARELGITQQRIRDVKKKARATLKQRLARDLTAGRRQP
jgi:RNA polymerase sigma factor (sigma-70 family)